MNQHLKIPKYFQIKESLKKSILSGDFKLGEQIPTEAALARQFHVSPITIIHALSELVSDGLIVRYQGKGSFVSKVLTNKREIGIIVFDIGGLTHPFFSQLMQGIEAASPAEKYNIHIYPVKGRTIQNEATLLNQVIIKKQMHALIITSPISKSDIEFLKKAAIPLVVAGIEYQGVEVPTVLIDVYHQATAAVEYMLQREHRQIGLIAGPRNKPDEISGGNKVANAFQCVLKKHAIPCDEAFIWDGEQTEEEAYRLMCAALDASPRPTALIVSGTAMTRGVLRALADRHLRVPEDMDLFAMIDQPDEFPFPTLRSPVFEMGQMAVNMLEHLDDHTIKRPVMLSDFSITGRFDGLKA